MQFDKPVIFVFHKIGSIMIAVCWDVIQCGSAEKCEITGGNCCLHLYYNVEESSLQRRVFRDFSHADCLNAFKLFFEFSFFKRITLRCLQIFLVLSMMM